MNSGRGDEHAEVTNHVGVFILRLFDGNQHALVLLAFQMIIQHDLGVEFQIANVANEPVGSGFLSFQFLLARVLLAIQVRLVDHARVEFDVANPTHEVPVVRWVNLRILALFPGLPLLILDSLDGRDWAKRDRRQERVVTGLLELLDVVLAAEMRVENPKDENEEIVVKEMLG